MRGSKVPNSRSLTSPNCVGAPFLSRFAGEDAKGHGCLDGHLMRLQEGVFPIA